jgi:hypothetical protein
VGDGSDDGLFWFGRRSLARAAGVTLGAVFDEIASGLAGSGAICVEVSAFARCQPWQEART